MKKRPQITKCKKCVGTGEHASIKENYKCFSCQGKGWQSLKDRLREVRYEIKTKRDKDAKEKTNLRIITAHENFVKTNSFDPETFEDQIMQERQA